MLAKIEIIHQWIYYITCSRSGCENWSEDRGKLCHGFYGESFTFISNNINDRQLKKGIYCLGGKLNLACLPNIDWKNFKMNIFCDWLKQYAWSETARQVALNWWRLQRFPDSCCLGLLVDGWCTFVLVVFFQENVWVLFYCCFL